MKYPNNYYILPPDAPQISYNNTYLYINYLFWTFFIFFVTFFLFISFFFRIVFFLIILSIIVFLFLIRCRIPPRRSMSHFEGKIIGHRGCRYIYLSHPSVNSTKSNSKRKDNSNPYPLIENTINAMDFAIHCNVGGIEIDTRLTKDGVPIVFHDYLVDGILSGKGLISQLTFDEIQQMHFIKNPSLSIPTLQSILQYVKEKQILLMIEIKGIDFSSVLIKSVIKLIHQFEIKEQICIISFNPFYLYQTRVIDKDINTLLLFDVNLFQKFLDSPKSENLSRLFLPIFLILTPPLCFLCQYVIPWLLQLSGVGPCVDNLTPSYLNFCRKHGISLYTWVVNDRFQISSLIDAKLCVGTDYQFIKDNPPIDLR